MRVLELLNYLYIIQLDVEKLVHRFQGAFDRDIILEFDSDFVIHKGFEKAVDKD